MDSETSHPSAVRMLEACEPVCTRYGDQGIVPCSPNVSTTPSDPTDGTVRHTAITYLLGLNCLAHFTDVITDDDLTSRRVLLLTESACRYGLRKPPQKGARATAAGENARASSAGLGEEPDSYTRHLWRGRSGAGRSPSGTSTIFRTNYGADDAAAGHRQRRAFTEPRYRALGRRLAHTSEHTFEEARLGQRGSLASLLRMCPGTLVRRVASPPFGAGVRGRETAMASVLTPEGGTDEVRQGHRHGGG